MAVAAAFAEKIEYQDDAGVMPAPPEIAIDAPRYVACLFDFIEPLDKAQLRGIGAHAGGLRLGASDTEGCPTMWRTGYMIRRGAFTPLESTTIQAKGDEFTADIDNPKAIGYRVKYPASDILLLSDERHKSMGVVEIEALRNHLWQDGYAKELQLHFFPDFNLWRMGEKPFPTILRIYEEMVMAATIETEDHATTQRELLESARLSRAFAFNQIETNRARILSTRNVDMAGFAIRWSERAKLYAAQLEVSLEPENEVSSASPVADVPSSDRYASALERANELKERELQLLERKYTEPAHQGEAAVVAATPPIPAIVMPAAAFSDTDFCTAVTVSGKQCKRKAVANGRCQLPAHRVE